MILLFLRLLAAVALAFVAGKLVSKLKLPSILGWLIAGMILGPHAVSLVSDTLLDAVWYQSIMHVLECAVGLMIGTELVWRKIRRSGKAIIITTLTQSIGTFLVVSLVFGIVFYFSGIPLYLAFLFGGTALATAPAPALSIVREFKTEGPVTATLIPMAALDDIVGCIVFFSTIAIVAGNLSAGELPAYMIALVVLLPLIIGVVTGLLAGLVLKKERGAGPTLALLIAMILLSSGVGFWCNDLLPRPVLNFMLIGMAFSATFSNMVSEKRLDQIMQGFNPILGVAMIVVILNLGAPLDYHLILGAGLYTAIYIAARAFGKYFGAFFGAAVTKSPKTVRNYLGLTLLPHSGVSLVFTGIAVSVLAGPAPACAKIIQGTIAAAAVINEVIAVVMAKKGFEWAGEFDRQEATDNVSAVPLPPVITISRQHGSGGRMVGHQLSQQLKIPFYDHEIIERAVNSSTIDQSFFEEAETRWAGSLLDGLSRDVGQGLSVDDRVFLHQSQIIRQIASENSCIIVGRCADQVLKDRQNVIRVFIYADRKSRQHRLIHTYHETTDHALADIERTDKRRASYYSFYSGRQFGDADNYDICLNSSALGIDGCVQILKDVYRSLSAATQEP
ncbi:cytidylate kinase [Anaerotruncus sp. 2789STDY5834896]|uniref:Cytidylate kinase n=1 Tax=uncultured Anaerotruncus sp. TaxID=905011 RepID=A0A1C6ISV6_9FIRM|nr:cytidylate kinase [uncultured Anaerotruncus sp.]